MEEEEERELTRILPNNQSVMNYAIAKNTSVFAFQNHATSYPSVETSEVAKTYSQMLLNQQLQSSIYQANEVMVSQSKPQQQGSIQVTNQIFKRV
jgi:hypothetical protein